MRTRRLSSTLIPFLLILFLTTFFGCACRQKTPGLVEFTFNGRKIRWEGVQITIIWLPGEFAWHFWISSFRTLSWRNNPKDKSHAVATVSISFNGSPNQIATFNDLPEKTFDSKGFTLAIPGHLRSPEGLLTSWLVSNTPERSSTLWVVIDHADTKNRRVAGRFEGKAFFKKAGQPENAGVAAVVNNGIFDLPIYPANREQQLPWTKQEADAIKEQYSPNHYVAFQTIQRAASAHDSDAELQMGMMCHMGQAVPQDDQKAREWFEKAAEDGSSLAMYYLGQWAAVDQPRRYFWSKLAILNGERSRSYFSPDQAAAFLTRDQIDQIEKEIQLWLKRHPRRNGHHDKVISFN